MNQKISNSARIARRTARSLTFHSTISVVALNLLAFSPAFAQQLNVNGGSQTASGQTYTVAGSGSAVTVTNGGAFTMNGGTINAVGTPGGYPFFRAVDVEGTGGSAVLNNVTLTVGQVFGVGLLANGTGNSITAHGGTLNSDASDVNPSGAGLTYRGGVAVAWNGGTVTIDQGAVVNVGINPVSPTNVANGLTSFSWNGAVTRLYLTDITVNAIASSAGCGDSSCRLVMTQGVNAFTYITGGTYNGTYVTETISNANGAQTIIAGATFNNAQVANRTADTTGYGSQLGGTVTIGDNGSIHTTMTTSVDGIMAVIGTIWNSAASRNTTNVTNAVITTHGTVANNGQVFWSGFYGATGAFADVGGDIHIHGGSILTTGNGSSAIEATDNSGSYSALGVGGSGTISVDAVGAQAHPTLTTSGNAAHGAWANIGGRITLTDAAVSTSGAGSYGLYASRADNTNSGTRFTIAQAASITGTGGSISTTGAGSHGAVSEGPGSLVALTGTALSATGSGADAANANSGATLSLTNATSSGARHGVSVSAPLTLYSSFGAPAMLNTITVSGGSLQANGGDAFNVNAANATILVQNNATVSNASGRVLGLSNAAYAHFTAENETLNGDIIADATSNGDVFLTLNTTLTGRIDPVNVTIDDTSVWNVTGNSVVGTLTNAGQIAFVAAGGFKTVTATDYIGQGGRILMNTYLGGDGSPSDKLIIDGGTATGSTYLTIRNAGGPGAQISHDGILVVQAINGAVTTGDSPSDPTQSKTFQMAPGLHVVAGAYEYFLYSGGDAATGGDPTDQNWYLRNTYTPPPTSDNPDPQPVPIIRPEVPISMVIPPLAIEYGYAMLDTLHERVGETYLHNSGPATEERVVWCKDASKNFKCVVRVPVANANGAGKDETRWARSGWARLLGDRGLHQPDNFMRRGPNYDYTFGGIQAGLDIYAREQADGTLDKAGIYVGYGQITSNVKGQFGGKAGSVDMDAYTLAGYWTHHSPNGWYTDAVVQGTWYSADAKSVYGTSLKPDGFGILGSLEGGYAFKLGSGWTLEPQAQIVYQNVLFDHIQLSNAFVRFDDGDSLRGRLGVRVTKTWNRAEDGKEPRLITAWLRANIWHEFLSKTKTSWGSVDGSTMVPFNSYIGGTWGEIGAGVTAQMTDKINIFATGAYNRSLDNKGREGWDGRLGMTVKW